MQKVVQILSILDLDTEMTPYDTARVVIVPCPYEGTVSYGAGTAGGPAAIIEATSQLELYDVELGIVTHERVPLACVSAPELPVADGPEAVSQAIEAEVARHLAAGKQVFCLGGEHSITIGAARAHARYLAQRDLAQVVEQGPPGPGALSNSAQTAAASACSATNGHNDLRERSAKPTLSFLQIDAHLDLRASYQGSAYSHACVGTHLAALGTVVPVGVRVAAKGEMRAIKQHELEPMWGSDIYRSRTQHGHDSVWIDAVSARLGVATLGEGKPGTDRPEKTEREDARRDAQAKQPVYVTLDVDGIDPSVVPSTGTPVPGGIDWYPLLHLLKTIGERYNVVGCDIVELIPGHTPSTFTTALLMKKMIGYFWAN